MERCVQTQKKSSYIKKTTGRFATEPTISSLLNLDFWILCFYFFSTTTETELPDRSIVHVFLLLEGLCPQSPLFRTTGDPKRRNGIVFLHPIGLGLSCGATHPRGGPPFGGQTKKYQDWISRAGFDALLLQPSLLWVHYSPSVFSTQSSCFG